jgi:hypothetical protein
MAFGRTPEQKAAEDEQRVVQRGARAEEWAARAQAVADSTREYQTTKDRNYEATQVLPSPMSQATTAKEQGQGFFEIQLKVGSSQRDSTVFGGNNDNIERTRIQSHAGTLAAIESIGWRLEHVGYVFVVTSESSRDKMLRTGQQTAVSGDTIGIYLFRNVD